MKGPLGDRRAALAAGRATGKARFKSSFAGGVQQQTRLARPLCDSGRLVASGWRWRSDAGRRPKGPLLRRLQKRPGCSRTARPRRGDRRARPSFWSPVVFPSSKNRPLRPPAAWACLPPRWTSCAPRSFFRDRSFRGLVRRWVGLSSRDGGRGG